MDVMHTCDRWHTRRLTSEMPSHTTTMQANMLLKYSGFACAQHLVENHGSDVSVRVVVRSEKFKKLYDGMDVQVGSVL